jgi:hypothetical protein
MALFIREKNVAIHLHQKYKKRSGNQIQMAQISYSNINIFHDILQKMVVKSSKNPESKKSNKIGYCL